MPHLRSNLEINNNPPQLGEIRKGGERGLKSTFHKSIWVSCPNCHKERWISLHDYKVHGNMLCRSCAAKKAYIGNKNSHWKGGRIQRGKYIRIKLQPDDFFYSMAGNCKGYVLEHRLVMAKHLGRCLHNFEIVHHKNHKPDDNRLENLQLISNDKHNQITKMESRIKFLENKVIQLKAEVILLRRPLNGVLIG